jgi:sulfur-carrier protein
MIKLLYFAGVREALGRSTETVDLPAGVSSIGALRGHLGARGEPWSLLAGNRGWRFAVNRAMTGSDDVAINDGDEVAIFPPVTGG